MPLNSDAAYTIAGVQIGGDEDGNCSYCPECGDEDFLVWQKYCNANYMCGTCPNCGLHLDDEEFEELENDSE